MRMQYYIALLLTVVILAASGCNTTGHDRSLIYGPAKYGLNPMLVAPERICRTTA